MTTRSRYRHLHQYTAELLGLLLIAGLAACGSSSPPSTPTGGSSTPIARASPAVTLPTTPGAGKKFYVSIGDSYAAGYQPAATGAIGATSTTGFVYRLAAEATVNGKKLTVVNFACSGATTTSVLKENGCGAGRLGPAALNYPATTQAMAAAAFISAHRADVGLISVSLGGNDVTSCAKAANVVTCLTSALVSVKANLTTLLGQLRTAAGADVPIVGITYPDVILGTYVSSNPTIKALASLSVTAFKSLINPALSSAYSAFKATFIDVTAATDAYVPFTRTTALAPYGTVPESVAKVCELTFYCQLHDIHPRDDGYQLIADLIKKALPA